LGLEKVPPPEKNSQTVPFGAWVICGASMIGCSQLRSGRKIATAAPVRASPSFESGAAQMVVGPDPGRLLLSDFHIR